MHWRFHRRLRIYVCVSRFLAIIKPRFIIVLCVGWPGPSGLPSFARFFPFASGPFRRLFQRVKFDNSVATVLSFFGTRHSSGVILFLSRVISRKQASSFLDDSFLRHSMQVPNCSLAFNRFRSQFRYIHTYICRYMNINYIYKIILHT